MSTKGMSTAATNERAYLDALIQIKNHGLVREDRTGTGTTSVFGSINCEFSLQQDGTPIVPLLSTKKVNFDAIKHELIWMLSGDSNVRYLKAHGVNIWDDWVIPGTEEYRMLEHGERIRRLKGASLEQFLAHGKAMSDNHRSDAFRIKEQCRLLDRAGVPEHALTAGELGPVYGAQWRKFPDIRIVQSIEVDAYREKGYLVVHGDGRSVTVRREVDQIARLEQDLRNNPFSRRLIVSAWNPAYVDEMALPPCHTLAQWSVSADRTLSCKLYMRSADFCLGVPYNIVFYSAMTHMLCKSHNMTPGSFHLSVGDAHVYSNHMEGIETQLGRSIIEDNCPQLIVNERSSILDYSADDLQLEGYVHDSFIPFKVAV